MPPVARTGHAIRFTTVTLKKQNAQSLSVTRSIRAFACIFGIFLALSCHGQVGLPPVISVQPSDKTALENATVTFSVVASSGTAMSYKWFYKGVAISGATASSYTNTRVNVGADDGAYYVEIRNTAGLTTSRTANLTILATNDLPVGRPDSYSVLEDSSLTVSGGGILANDSDVYPGGLFSLLVSNVSAGTLTFSTNGSFLYFPATNFNGTDRFTYRPWDGVSTNLEQNTTGGSKLEIKNSSPAAQSFRHGIAGGPSYTIGKVMFRISRKANQSKDLNFSIGTGLNSGAIPGSTYTVTMASVTDTTEGASFQDYQILYATPVGPLTAGTTYYLNFDNSPSGQDLYLEMSSSSTYSKGTAYKDGADELKDIRFEIHAVDAVSPTTVTITVQPVNDVPIAVTNLYTTQEDTALVISTNGVLANDSDVEGDVLQGLLISNVVHGSLTFMSNGSFTYIPNKGFNGGDSFSYRVADSASTGNVAKVALRVSPVVNELRFVSQQRVTNGMNLEIRGPDLSWYVLQTSTNFSDWTAISTNLRIYGAWNTTDRTATNGDLRIYRAVIPAYTNLQQNPLGGNSVKVTPGSSLSQTFRHGVAGGSNYGISKIVVRLSREAAPNGNLDFSIKTLSGEVIGESAFTITTGSITNTSNGSSFQRYEITYPEPVGPFEAGTTYYLHFVSRTTNSDDYLMERSSGNTAYSRGTLYNGATDMDRDLVFELWGH